MKKYFQICGKNILKILEKDLENFGKNILKILEKIFENFGKKYFSQSAAPSKHHKSYGKSFKKFVGGGGGGLFDYSVKLGA